MIIEKAKTICKEKYGVSPEKLEKPYSEEHYIKLISEGEVIFHGTYQELIDEIVWELEAKDKPTTTISYNGE